MDTEATKPPLASLFPPNIYPLVPYDRRAQVSVTAGAAKTATGLLGRLLEQQELQKSTPPWLSPI